MVTGGSILFGKYPSESKKISNTTKYLGHFVIMFVISAVGIVYQRREIRKLNEALE